MEPEALSVINTIFQGLMSIVVTGVGWVAVRQLLFVGRWTGGVENKLERACSDLDEIKTNLKDSKDALWQKLGGLEVELKDARERLARVEAKKIEVRQ